LKEILLFDFDGVLIDSEGFYNNLWKSLLKDYKIGFDEKCLIGKTNQQFLVQFDLDVHQIANLIEIKTKIETNYFRKEKMNPLISLLIAQLSSKYKMGIVSNNNFANIKGFLSNNKCSDYFDYLVTSESGVPAKPAPDSYLNAISFFKCNKEQVLVLEDSPIGMKAAENAGLDRVLFTHHALKQSIQKLEIALNSN
jgi:beta-phosphoglucomutase